MATFGPKPWLNPFGKMSIFLVLELLVLIAYKGVFSLQNIVKDIFLTSIPYKKKRWKNGHIWSKTMNYPFGKMSILRLFELPVFVAQKGVFSFQSIVNNIFLTNIAYKKMLENGHIWSKTMNKPIWKNVNFVAQEGVFSFQNIVNNIFLINSE